MNQPQGTEIPFCPTPKAKRVLGGLLNRHSHMDGFRDGPFSKNELSDTESALWAATYEIRQLIGQVNNREVSDRLAGLWELDYGWRASQYGSEPRWQGLGGRNISWEASPR